ncbi:hypothetical protein DPMN_173220 [Dreissena polymorpha]|nr:hypothetical protein DPMN_173220 [Dreissena polymorpha]
MRGTALCAAIEARNYDITKLLLDAGCDVNACDFDGEPPILLAIRKALPVFHKKASASHAFQLSAVETGSFSLVDLIVNHEKCNLNKMDPITKQTALHLSVREKLESLVVMLMTSQSSIPCDVRIKNGQGETALHLAASTGNTGLLEALLQSDSCLGDVFTGLQTFRGYPYNTAGLTALHVTCKHGQLASLKLLVERLRSLSALNYSSDGALDGASKRDNDVLAQNINALTLYERQTCLHLAAREGRVQVVRYLVQNQIDVDVKDAMGNSPLFLFLVSEANWNLADYSVPELLLRHGANPNITLCVRNSRHVSRTLDVAPLMLAAMQDNLELARVLIQHGADVNMTDNSGNTALYHALRQSSAKVASYLFKDCAHTNVNIENVDGETCLIALASFKGDADLMQQLVGAIFDKGGDMAVDRAGRTVLHEAFDNENHLLMDAVLERIGKSYANRICLVNNLLTMEEMLVEAVKCGCLLIVRVLLSHNVDIDTKNCEQYKLVSCLTVSLQAHEIKVAKYLIGNGCSLYNNVIDVRVGYATTLLLKGRNTYRFQSESDDCDSSDDISDDSDQGDKIDAFIDELVPLFKDAFRIPRSLKLMCLCCIRKRLIANEVSFSKVHLLPLPLKLQNSIRYRLR